MRHRLDGFEVPIRPSRLWLCFVLLVALAACPALWSSVPQALWLLPLMLWRCWRADGWWRTQTRVTAFRVLSDSGCQLQAAGVWFWAVVRNDSVAWPWLIVLNLDVSGRRRSVVLFVDSAPAAARRRLRVYLRWPPGAVTV
jgi:toxin CptA